MRILFIVIIFFSFWILGVSECERRGGLVSPEIKSLCVIDAKEMVCWKDREDIDGYKMGEIDGFFAVSPEDLTKITDRLIECRELTVKD